MKLQDLISAEELASSSGNKFEQEYLEPVLRRGLHEFVDLSSFNELALLWQFIKSGGDTIRKLEK